MTSKSTMNSKSIKVRINFKEKETMQMNAVRKTAMIEGAYQNDWSKKSDTELRIVTTPKTSTTDTRIIQPDLTEKMAKDYLNEKLYYFYNNGGPIMDI